MPAGGEGREGGGGGVGGVRENGRRVGVRFRDAGERRGAGD